MRLIATTFASSIGRTAAIFAVTGLMAVAGLAPCAHAQTIFSSGVPDDVGAYESDAGPTPKNFEAETFTLGGSLSSVITSVSWYGVYYSPTSPTVPSTDNFKLAFYTTSGGTPSTMVGSTVTVGNSANRVTSPSNGSTAGVPDFLYTYTLPTAVTLAPGTYAFSVWNNTGGGSATPWYWDDSNEGGSNYNGSSPTSFPNAETGTLAFALNGTNGAAAPEPGSLLLIGPMLTGGIAGFIARRRRA